MIRIPPVTRRVFLPAALQRESAIRRCREISPVMKQTPFGLSVRADSLRAYPNDTLYRYGN